MGHQAGAAWSRGGSGEVGGILEVVPEGAPLPRGGCEAGRRQVWRLLGDLPSLTPLGQSLEDEKDREEERSGGKKKEEEEEQEVWSFPSDPSVPSSLIFSLFWCSCVLLSLAE